jgi:pimeloyl-ACP methyl ester carboxylesterase
MENDGDGLQGIPVSILQVFQDATSHEGYEPVRLVTPKGEISCRYYTIAESRSAVIWVGGAGGDWDTPAQLLFPKLCRELLGEGISSLRIKYRDPRNLSEATYDVMAGLTYLHLQKFEIFGLVGHSLGGAVVIRAAALDTSVKAVITLSTQSYGAGAVSELGPRCAVLILHGSKDTVLSSVVSEHVFSMAKEPKRIIIYEGASHILDETAMEVHEDVKDWIIQWVRQ